SDVLEDSRAGDYRGIRSVHVPLHALLSPYAMLGIHPFDPAGIRRIKASVGEDEHWYTWTELFERTDPGVDWGDGGARTLWIDRADIGVNNRVRLFAEAVWGSDAGNVLNRFISRLRTDGHPDALIHTSRLWVRLTKPDEPAWRCARCSRVHLHFGVGACTRC